MKISTYFFSAEAEAGSGLAVAPGYGFTAEGRWRPIPLPRGAGLAVDDRFLPGPEGLREAVAALGRWKGWILWDFERPPAPALSRLLETLQGVEAAVPPTYAGLPHSRVLIGPYVPGSSFGRWLAAQKARYGPVLLDGAPIRHRAFPGRPPEYYPDPLPETGFPCPGAGCLHRRQKDGAVLYWDTCRTVSARCEAAGVPVIAAAADWNALGE